MPNTSPPRLHFTVLVTMAEPFALTGVFASTVIVTSVKSVNSNAPMSHFESRVT